MIVYGMPVQLAVMSTLNGAAFGLFPIAWIVFSSIMLYRLAVDTGKFEVIKDSVGGLTNDRRLQALLIAFSFGAFIEGAAGFGAPVAVAGAMLAGLGFAPFYAAGICLLANTAPVAFGSIGIPVTTLAGITGLPVLLLTEGLRDDARAARAQRALHRVTSAAVGGDSQLHDTPGRGSQTKNLGRRETARGGIRLRRTQRSRGAELRNHPARPGIGAPHMAASALMAAGRRRKCT